MTLSQAETEIYKKIGQFTGVEKANLRIENQLLNNGLPFKAPTDKPWCKVFVQYAVHVFGIKALFQSNALRQKIKALLP